MIRKILFKIYNSINTFRVNNHRGIVSGDDLKVRGKPIINIKDGGKLLIGKNVTLNSSNANYHVNMFAPVKLFIDRTGASIEIGANTRIHGSCIHAQESIWIGKNCLIASNCQVFDSNGHELSFGDVSNRINTISTPKKIIINDNVWIGINSIILPGAIIGEGCVIAAGSVVKGEIPPFTLAGGNPIKIIKRFD